MRRPTRATEPPADGLRGRLTHAPWRLLNTGAAPGAWNMALDVALLDAAAREAAPPALRFYGWCPPAVSLGRFQDETAIDLAHARARGWDVIRRPTGGRAVLHQLELTYSIVLPPSVLGGAGVRSSYAVLVSALNHGLGLILSSNSNSLPTSWSSASASPAPRPFAPSPPRSPSRTPNCFALAEECDTVAGDGKLVGSAQLRRGGALLQHGSILVDAEPEAWEALFGTAGRLVSLAQLLGSPPAPQTVADAVSRGFEELGVRLEEASLAPIELDAADGGAALYRL